MSRIGFVFPGQGAQHVGMGKEIARGYPEAKELFRRADEILGYELSQVIFEGPAEELDSTVISQPAIFVTSLAALEMLRVERPDLVQGCEITAGLSLGEYTALVFSQALSFEEGLKLVQQRGQAMQDAADATPSGMVSLLLLEVDKVEEIRAEAAELGTLEIANLLCPGNVVVSGENAACERVAELAEEAGGRAIPLAVAGAFHTSIMKPADEKLREALDAVSVASPQVPVVFNVDAQQHSDPDEIRSLLVRQVVSPVLWEASVRAMLDAGVDDFYEIGPGKVLTGLLKRISRKTPSTPVNNSWSP